MHKKLILLFFFHLVLSKVSNGQHEVNFQIPTQVCLGETLLIENTSDSGEADWKFCQPLKGDYTTTVGKTINPSLAGMSIIEHNGSWVGFAVSRDNQLFRINFGDSPANSNYSVTPLGNPGGLLNAPDWIQVVENNGKWYGLVTNQSNEIIKLIWSDLAVNPTAQSLNFSGSGKLNAPAQVEIVVDGNNYVAIVANSGSNQLALINFGTSMENMPDADDIILSPVFSGSINMFGVTAKQVCGEWTVYTSVTNKMYKVEIGSMLFKNIDVSQIIDFTSDLPILVGSYVRLKSIVEDGDTYIYFTSYTSNIFSGVVWPSGSTNAEFIDLTNLSVPSQLYSLEVYSYNNSFGFYIGSFDTGLLNQILINYECATNRQTSTEFTPTEIHFTTAGNFSISLTMKFPDGFICSIKKQIIVNSLIAPDVELTSSNICASKDVNFTSQNLSGNIISYNWNFGDGKTSSQSSPISVYDTEGTYAVVLQVTASNGCQNFDRNTIKMYNPPTAAFSLPSGLICTNNEFTFTNTTADVFDGNLTYQWLVNTQAVSTDRDLLFAFNTGGAKNITLKTSIPGCSNEITKTLTNVDEGPTVDFAIVGKCQNETILFTNNSNGAIASYAWDFGNSETSTTEEPSSVFNTSGIYPIELAITGTNGCVSTKVINHQIYSLPQPNFSIDLPPFSCSGSSTNFTDLTPALTDSNLETWLWNFDDQNNTSADQAPQHIYGVAGDYDVVLTITSDKLCANTISKTITISSAPNPIISNTPACEDRDVLLSDGSGTVATEWIWQVDDTFYFTPAPLHVFSNPGTYTASLTVTASNGCIGSETKQIIIQAAPAFDFTSEGKCANNEATFVATVANTNDAVVDFTWQFDGDEKKGSQAKYIFQNEGLHEALLTLTTATGCKYSLNKSITILPTFIADFSFSPESGPPPLQVQFTNHTVNATSFIWAFNDLANSTSTQISPSFTFTEFGNYPVDLRVLNAENCESTISKLVNVELPFINVVLNALQIQEISNGTIQISLTIENQGNMSAQNLPVEIELSNGTRLSEIITESINKRETIVHRFSTTLFKSSDLRYVCASISMAGNSASQISLCKSFEIFTIFNSPYPSPANQLLTIDWVSAVDEEVVLTIVNQQGKQFFTQKLSAFAGFNRKEINVQPIQSGLYFIKLKSSSIEKTFRTIIAH